MVENDPFFFFLFSHLENTPSYQGKHMWLLFHLCVSRNGGSGSQAISAFVHRPKCVWCVEKQTKTSANGIRLTLDKYNSHRKCVMLLFLIKKGGGVVNAHMNASKRWLCKPYKTWNTFRSHQLQTVSCFYVIILTTAILPFPASVPLTTFPHVLSTYSRIAWTCTYKCPQLHYSGDEVKAPLVPGCD